MDILVVFLILIIAFFILLNFIDKKRQEIRDGVAINLLGEIDFEETKKDLSLKIGFLGNLKNKIIETEQDSALSVKINPKKFHDKCPDCANGYLVLRRGRRNKKFFGCSNYPRCHHTQQLVKKEKNEIMEEIFNDIKKAYL